LIAYISGNVIEMGADGAVVEAGGIGYRIAATARTLSGLVVGTPHLSLLDFNLETLESYRICKNKIQIH
jgi:Holliday junction resolvasome RuvABC DNA-binding subunit